MAVQTAARRRAVTQRAAPQNTTTTASEVTPEYTPPSPGRSEFDCLICGGHGTLTVEPRLGGGWWVNCWKPECKGLSSGDWLRAVAAEVGAPGGGALLADPLRYLGRPLSANVKGDPDELPSAAQIAGCHSRLMAENAPLDYLLEKRSLTLDILREFKIGWDGEAFTFPVYDADFEVVQLVRRRWPAPWVTRSGKRVPYKVLKGHGAYLYPQPLPERGWLLLAGTLDAVLGRQHGLPAVTSICGTSFPDRWHPLVRGRRVFVMYDVGEEQVMNGRVASLRAAGADATAVRLSRLLHKGQGKDLSDALTGSYTRHDLVKLIEREKEHEHCRKVRRARCPGS